MSISDKSNHIDMNKRDLKKLSKSELIKLLLKQENKKPEIIVVDDTKPIPKPRTYKPRPPIQTPRKSGRQMVEDYEEKPKPVPTPRTKLEQTNKALEGYAKS